MLRHIEVTHGDFKIALDYARRTRPLIDTSLSPTSELPETHVRYFLATDDASGFGVTHDGVLVGLFSSVKGRGESVIKAAKLEGATMLDCFAGYLTLYYQAHGFTEVLREPHWAGGPDVVYMELVPS